MKERKKKKMAVLETVFPSSFVLSYPPPSLDLSEREYGLSFSSLEGLEFVELSSFLELPLRYQSPWEYHPQASPWIAHCNIPYVHDLIIYFDLDLGWSLDRFLLDCSLAILWLTGMEVIPPWTLIVKK